MSKWQPMDSAPKDRRILLRIKGCHIAVSGRWEESVELADYVEPFEGCVWDECRGIYMVPPEWYADLLPWDDWMQPIEPDAWAELPGREDA